MTIGCQRNTQHEGGLLRAQVLQEDGTGSFSTLGGTSAECALSAVGSTASRPAWSPCGSTPTYANLEDGAYTFTARAPSTSSNIAHQYARSNFTVDTSAPSVTVRRLGCTQPPCCASLQIARHHIWCNAVCLCSKLLRQLVEPCQSHVIRRGCIKI